MVVVALLSVDLVQSVDLVSVQLVVNCSIFHIFQFFRIFRLARFDNDRTISFIPPDGEFELMSYRLNTQVKPLIWIESEIETHSHSRVEIMVKAKSQFKRRSTANNVEIVVPGILNT